MYQPYYRPHITKQQGQKQYLESQLNGQLVVCITFLNIFTYCFPQIGFLCSVITLKHSFYNIYAFYNFYDFAIFIY